MAEDWVRLQLGMRLQIGILRYIGQCPGFFPIRKQLPSEFILFKQKETVILTIHMQRKHIL